MAFVIPTIYTAVDRVSAVAQRVAAANMSIANSAALAADQANHAWDKFMPDTDDALKRRFQFMVSMGKAMAIAGTAIYSTKAIMDYEKELANLKALTGATGTEFEGYKRIIQDVAKQTTVSSVDIAQAFTAIGNAMPELLGSADALGQMTNAAVTLGRAANMEMLPAAEALTGIMNQFGKSADFAATAVDMLAAGSQAGSAELQDLQATMLGFGKAAAISGIKFEEAINLAELISKTRKGSEAGVQLRNIFVEMNKGARIDEKALKSMMRLGINVRMVSDATVPVKLRLQEMAKALKDPTALAEIFGKENAVAAVALLQNVAAFDAMNERIKEQGIASKMAKEQTQTLYAALSKVKAAWTNLILESDGANAGLSLIKSTLRFVADNMGLILNLAVPILSFFALWRLRIIYLSSKAIVLTHVQTALNYTVALATVITGKYTSAMFATEAGMLGLSHAATLMNLGLTSFIMLSAGVVFALAAITHQFLYGYDSSVDYVSQLKKTKDGLYELAKPLTTLEIKMQLFNKAMEDFRELQNYEGYFKSMSPLGRLAANFTEPFANPRLYFKYQKAIEPLSEFEQGGLRAPAMEDFGFTQDSVSAFRANKPQNTTQTIHHTVDITQNGRSIASFDTSAGMPNVSRTY